MSLQELDTDTIYSILDVLNWYSLLIFSSTCYGYKSLHHDILQTIENDPQFRNSAQVKIYGLVKKRPMFIMDGLIRYSSLQSTRTTYVDIQYCQRKFNYLGMTKYFETEQVAYLILKQIICTHEIVIGSKITEIISGIKYTKYIGHDKYINFWSRHCVLRDHIKLYIVVNTINILGLFTGAVTFASTLKIPNLYEMLTTCKTTGCTKRI